jgi:UDP-GlcNAc:undecaprenyl-phosphate GlcNAc-1-phosphate transferase
MSSLWLAFSAATVVTIIVIAALRPVAERLDFVDRPGGRKIHDAQVPVVGGLAMWVGFFVGSAVLPAEVRPPLVATALGFMFVTLGLLDDRFSLSAAFRLAVQGLGAIVMVLLGGLAVHFVGSPFGPEIVVFDGWAATMLCVLLVAGAMNAMNMVDGIDGLAGSLAALAFSAVATVALASGNAEVLAISVIAVGVAAAFLIFNLPLGFNRPIRTFMGDAGSLFLGFLLSWSLIALSQDSQSIVSPVTLLWLIAMPIFDMGSTAIGRMANGHSPFFADTSHFHHSLLRRGLPVPAALVVLIALSVVWIGVGWALDRVLVLPDYVSLLTFIAAGGVTHAAIRFGDPGAATPTPTPAT